MEKAKTDRWYVCSFGPFAIVSIYFFLFFMSVDDAFCVVCPPRKHEIDALMVFFFAAIARTTTD